LADLEDEGVAGMTLQELQNMTVVRLRQEAMQHDGIEGVSGMSKAQLVEALVELLGIDADLPARLVTAKISGDKAVLKSEIRTLKSARDEASAAGDSSGQHRTRTNIKKRKRALRRLAEKAQVTTA
jgi:hypothetical protein